MSVQPNTDLIDTLLSVIPSLPRTILDRLVTDMIDRMDELDGDPDLEDDEREPEWCGRNSSAYHLPERAWGRAGRLRCGRFEPWHRHRPISHPWRKHARH